MFDYTPLFEALREAGQGGWAGELKDRITDWHANHGDAHRWKAAVEHLPEIAPEYVELFDTVRVESSVDEATQMKLADMMVDIEAARMATLIAAPSTGHGNASER